MISREEITKNKEVPAAYEADLEILLERINAFRVAYDKPMIVTSGFRTWEEHVEIYKQKAMQRGVPFYITQVPSKSKHLYCQAVDIADPDGALKAYILKNIKLMEGIEFWFEDFSTTTNWVHFQIYPPASGSRFFKP